MNANAGKFSLGQAFGESEAMKTKSVRFVGVPASNSSNENSHNQSNPNPNNLKKQQIVEAANNEISNVLQTSLNSKLRQDDSF